MAAPARFESVDPHSDSGEKPVESAQPSHPESASMDEAVHAWDSFAPKKSESPEPPEGPSLAEAESKAFEKGREALQEKKKWLDAEVETSANKFTEETTSWWQRTKDMFGKAAGKVIEKAADAALWVMNDKEIKKLNAHLAQIKEDYRREAEAAAAAKQKPAPKVEADPVQQRTEILVQRKAQEARLKGSPAEKLLRDFYSYEDQKGVLDTEQGQVIKDARLNEEPGKESLQVDYVDGSSLRKFPTGLVLRVHPGGRVEELKEEPVAEEAPPADSVKPAKEEGEDASQVQEAIDAGAALLETEQKKQAEESEGEPENPILLTPDMKKPGSEKEAGTEENPVLLTPEMTKKRSSRKTMSMPPAPTQPANEGAAPDSKKDLSAKVETDADPAFRGLFEEECLKFLQTKDAKWFNSRFNGEVGPSGYLIDLNGVETDFLPSQNVGIEYDRLKKASQEAFARGERLKGPYRSVLFSEQPKAEGTAAKATPEKKETVLEKLENGLGAAAAKALEMPDAATPKTFPGKIGKLSVEKMLKLFVAAGAVTEAESESLKIKLQMDSEAFDALRKKLATAVKALQKKAP